MIRKIVRATILAVLLFAVGFALLFTVKFTRAPDTQPKKILFVIDKGKSVSAVAEDMRAQGVIREKWPLLLGYRIFFRQKTLKAGEYALNIPLSPRAVLIALTEGKVALHALTVPEGLTRRETAKHMQEVWGIDEAEFLSLSDSAQKIQTLDREAVNLEGYLFPETYHFPRGAQAETIIDAMVEQFKSTFSPEWMERAEELGMTVREVVTLASLVEKETSLPEERPLVSAVFHNRLRRGMKLDCDPTIIYALKEKGHFDGNLRKKDMSLDSPYNTYVNGGLPPGPIANPGRAALEAALYPAETSHLYFVSKNDGSHYFSSSFREHQNAVNRYQRRRR